jgi:hypothetical protein
MFRLMEAHRVKHTTEETTMDGIADGMRRGLFRRGKRATGADVPDGDDATASMVATVDDLARRMDELTASAEDDVRESLDLQRAKIARANEAASGPRAIAPTPTMMNIAPEATVTESTTTPPSSDTTAPEMPADEAQIQARMDAVLAPSAVMGTEPAPEAPSEPMVSEPAPSEQVTLEHAPAAELRPTTPVAAPVQVQAAAPIARVAPVAAPAPTPVQAPVEQASPAQAPAGHTQTAAQRLGIDVDRIAELIEEEARSAQQRIELEVRSAHAQSSEIIGRAEVEAERIREHGQAQARVLLGEVVEIISEAQQTGEQILHRSNSEATTIRSEAAAVLHQAQTEARAIVETARREGEQVLAEQRRLATVRAQEAMREQDRLKDQIRRLEERRRQVLESLEPLIAQLTQMMPTQAQLDPSAGNVVQMDRTRASQ